MKRLFLFILLSVSFLISSYTQIVVNDETLFGNEWIDYEQTYLKIKISEDGWYRISGAQLRANGVPINEISPSSFRLFIMGTPVPLVLSGEESFSDGDFIAFYGRKNRGELDRYLFKNSEEDMLNPYYSMFSDTSTYFLTWSDQNSPGPTYQEIANDLNNTPEKESWYWHIDRQVFKNRAFFKKYDSQNLVAYSIFDSGEGFATESKPNHIITFNPIWENTGPDAILRFNLHSERIANTLNVSFNGKQYIQEDIPLVNHFIKKELTIPLNEFSTTCTLNIKDERNNRIQYGVAFAELIYPRGFDAGGGNSFSFDLQAGPRRYFELENFNTENSTVWVFDLARQIKLKADIGSDNILRFALPASDESSKIIVLNESSGYKVINDITLTAFENLQSSQTDFLIISHKDLQKENNGTNWVQEYADYRSSEQGGGYAVQVLNIDQLYDQFAYGIYNHPLSIQNFGQYAARNWPRLKYILLLGHGYSYIYNRQGEDGLSQNHFIPTYGFPGSDNILLAPAGSSTPSFAIGRIAADSPEDIKIYLDKLKAYEKNLNDARTTEERIWRKRILHIVGGSRADEQQLFQQYLNGMGQTLLSNGFGGSLITVAKNNNEAVQQTTSEQVIESINSGVAIKTYLGHGGVTNTGFGLDNPFLFDNKGQYPLIFSLGCLTGFLYDQQKSLSESFVLSPEKGGIGYIASGGFAYPYALNALTREFYGLLGGDFYTAGVGEILQAMRSKFEETQDFGLYTLNEQMSYHGDPAVKMNTSKAPDYIIDVPSVKIGPNLLTTALDSFTLSFDVLNLGFNQADTFSILIQRTFPDGTKTSLKDTIQIDVGRSQYQYRFELGTENTEGEHRIEIQLDVDDNVSELPSDIGEMNNELVDNNGRRGISFFVQQNAILPLAPTDYGIMGDENIKLVASSNTLGTVERVYIFELDTTPDFNSGIKQSHEVTSKGGAFEWVPNVAWSHNQVYHWRVREKGLNEINWIKRSFVFLENHAPGWNQSQYYQMAEDSLFNLEKKDLSRQLEYQEGFFPVIGDAMNFSDANNDLSRYRHNGNRRYRASDWWGVANIGDSHICMVVFDPKSGRIWRNSRAGNFGSINGRRDNYPAFIFSVDQGRFRNDLAKFIEEVIPEGFYALLVTSQRQGSSLKVEDWAMDSLTYGTNLFSVLESQGARQVRDLGRRGSLPYAFGFVKDRGALGEMLVNDINSVATVSFNVPFLRSNACITSPFIGKAQQWIKMDWLPQQRAEETDEISLNLLAWNTDKSLVDTLQKLNEPGEIDLSDLDPSAYPYLQMEYCAEDADNFSFTELAFWRVYYEGLPDLVLGTGSDFVFQSDTLSQGALLNLRAEVVNLNAVVRDSVELKISVRSNNNQTEERKQQLAPLAKGEKQAFEFTFDTEQLEGAQELTVELNPSRRIEESQYANNLGVLPFQVVLDKINPLLDVTFDGRYILNGELVSAKPLINITLLDENEFLEINDTSSFQIWLDFPDGSTKAYFFEDQAIRFFPASAAEKNKARVEFSPILEIDGEYRLKVRASDATGNIAGASTYEINFQVINESQISNLLPYPNPFTSSCRFVYTLTGDQEPSDFKIQIMTVSGRIVREITKLEFGRLSIGTHTSDFIWDGTDEYGDRLANGVYLYRVVANDLEGKELKHFENSKVDKYFRKDIGKIVILR